MKALPYAFLIGAIFSFFIFLTNVVFPNNGPDNGTAVGFTYLVLFSLFGLGGYINSRQSKDKIKSGAVGGAITAFIVVGLIMLTFAFVDNVFLSTVSKQADKIAGFTNAKNQFHSMRDYINHGLLMGSIIVLPVVTIIGGLLGSIGAFSRSELKK